MKRIIVLVLAMFSAVTFYVFAEPSENGWRLTNSGEGRVEICSCEVLEGSAALHIENKGAEVTVSHLMGSTGSVRRNFKVTFYVKGSYNEEDIMVGTGDRTTGSNPDVITYMPLSHEKIEKSEYKNGWIRYSYLFRGSIPNNSEFKFSVIGGENELYIDNLSVVFDSATDDTSYIYTGQGIMPDGGFEVSVTSETGYDIEDYGWSSNIDNVTLTGEAEGAEEITPIARIIEDETGNKMMYVRYNSANWANRGLILTKNIGKTGWEDFYVSFKAKGAFLPNAAEVGSAFDDQLKKLAGGEGSVADNPFGDDVTVEELEDGWKKYTVRTYGEGSVFRVKFNCGCLDLLLDDFEVRTAAGTYLECSNGSFDFVGFDEKLPFAEGWNVVNHDGTAFSQRAEILGGWSVFMACTDTDDLPYFYQPVDSAKQGEEYIVSFESWSLFGDNSLEVGFGEDISDFEGIALSDMERDGSRYSFKVKMSGAKLIFAAAGRLEGIWIDNVSLIGPDGTELIKNGDFSQKTMPPVYSTGDFKLYKDGTEAVLGSGLYSVEIEAENNFGEDDMEFTLIICHNRGKKLIKYAENTELLMPNGDEEDPSVIKCDIDMSDYQAGDSLEVFLWDNTDDMNSLCSFGTF